MAEIATRRKDARCPVCGGELQRATQSREETISCHGCGHVISSGTTKPGPNRKRQALGLALVIASILYPASAGPFAYVLNRDWGLGSTATFNVIYSPIILAGGDGNSDWYRAYSDYVNWWALAAYRHQHGSD